MTTLQCVPPSSGHCCDTEGLATCDRSQVFSGGESALPKPGRRSCLAALPRCRLVNLYGPTECTINASAYTVDRATVADGPRRHTDRHIRRHDPRTTSLTSIRGPVAVGEIGELYIGGIQVARGYLDRPELTAERFITDPFPHPGEPPLPHR